MPNVGKHSTGCFSCRRMKVRCDETKPSCLRCMRGKRLCPGYSDGFVSVYPALKKKKIRQKAKSTSPKSSPSPSKDQSCLADIGHRTWLSWPRDTTEEWYDRSIKFFFYTNTHTRTQISGRVRRYLDLFEDHCSRSTSSAYLNEALKSAALANMAPRVPHVKWISDRAAVHHGKALEGIRKALGNDLSARSDDMLMALWCLEKAELMERDRDIVKNHSAGISAVIKLRGASASNSELGSQLFNAMNLNLATRDFVFGTSYHLPMETGYPPPYMLTSKVAQLVRTYRRFLSGHIQRSPATLLQQAHTLDAIIQSFSHCLVPVLRSEKRVIGATEIEVDHFENITDIFPRLNCHTMRIRLLRIAAECSKDAGVYDEEITAQVLAIVSLLPALLGETIEGTTDPLLREGCSGAGHIAIFALSTLVSTPEFVNEDIRQWAMDKYTFVGQAYGIKQALTFRDYFASGAAMTDSQRLMAMEHRAFPKFAPSFIVGHENPLASLIRDRKTVREGKVYA